MSCDLEVTNDSACCWGKNSSYITIHIIIYCINIRILLFFPQGIAPYIGLNFAVYETLKGTVHSLNFFFYSCIVYSLYQCIRRVQYVASIEQLRSIKGKQKLGTVGIYQDFGLIYKENLAFRLVAGHCLGDK